MATIRKAALLTAIFTAIVGGSLAGCTGAFSANATPSLAPAAQSSNSNASEVFNREPIQFQSGQTSTTVSNYLTLNQTDRYTFQASAGQPTTINISAPNQRVLLTIIDPDGNPIVASQDGVSNWSRVLQSAAKIWKCIRLNL